MFGSGSGWGKCLQASVVGLCRRSVHARAIRHFCSQCSNHDGSGLAGSLREGRIFLAVERFLKDEMRFVWVLGARSADGFGAGMAHGRWCLGDASGECLGVVCWLQSTGHVVKVIGQDAVSVAERVPLGDAATAPWAWGVACGKKGRRGEHLKGRGNDVSTQGNAKKYGSALEKGSVTWDG